MLNLSTIIDNGKRVITLRTPREKKYTPTVEKRIFQLGVNHVTKELEAGKFFTRDEIRSIIKEEFKLDKVSKGAIDNRITRALLLIKAINGQLNTKSMNAKRNADIKANADNIVALSGMLEEEFKYYLGTEAVKNDLK